MSECSCSAFLITLWLQGTALYCHLFAPFYGSRLLALHVLSHVLSHVVLGPLSDVTHLTIALNAAYNSHVYNLPYLPLRSAADLFLQSATNVCHQPNSPANRLAFIVSGRFRIYVSGSGHLYCWHSPSDLCQHQSLSIEPGIGFRRRLAYHGLRRFFAGRRSPLFPRYPPLGLSGRAAVYGARRGPGPGGAPALITTR